MGVHQKGTGRQTCWLHFSPYSKVKIKKCVKLNTPVVLLEDRGYYISAKSSRARQFERNNSSKRGQVIADTNSILLTMLSFPYKTSHTPVALLLPRHARPSSIRLCQNYGASRNATKAGRLGYQARITPFRQCKQGVYSYITEIR